MLRQLRIWFHEAMVRFYEWRLMDDNDIDVQLALQKKRDYHFLQLFKLGMKKERQA